MISHTYDESVAGGSLVVTLDILLLIALSLELESRRGENVNWQNKERGQLQRAPSVGRRNFDASRRGKKVLNPSRDKNARHVP